MAEKNSKRAIASGRLFVVSVLYCVLLCVPCAAQRWFTVEEQTKTATNGKMRVADKKLYYTRGSRLIVSFGNGPSTYYMLSNPFGGTDIYYPGKNELAVLDPGMFNTSDELLCIFADGQGSDLGLSREGYAFKSTFKDGDYTVRRYEPLKSGSMCAMVQLALDSSYHPVSCFYYDKKGQVITKTYLSHYTELKGFHFPMRVTEISYFGEQRDSTVRLDIYSNLRIDEREDMHDFKVPSDAVVIDIKKGLKDFKGK